MNWFFPPYLIAFSMRCSGFVTERYDFAFNNQEPFLFVYDSRSRKEMRINPFLNLKSSAAGGEGCSGDCGKGERECSGSWCFSDAKVLLDYYRELRFYFSSSLDLQLDEIGLSSDVVPGMDGEVVWR